MFDITNKYEIVNYSRASKNDNQLSFSCKTAHEEIHKPSFLFDRFIKFYPPQKKEKERPGLNKNEMASLFFAL